MRMREHKGTRIHTCTSDARGHSGFVPAAATTGGESSSISVVVQGKELALFSLPSGKYAAVDAVCPHQGGKLELGAIEECDKGIHVLCPRHAWSFDLSSGFCDVMCDYGVQAYDTLVTSDGIVCISEKARPQPALE
eukprot:Tamp_26948.p1 GENE.Tamp_26948~~Tamp_26948.p1  ORF type:complete len:136 (-),score=13.10 Tamp_26948:170-577(-)